LITSPLSPTLSPVPGEREFPSAVRHRRQEAGYNLVILMVVLTLLNIAIAIALPKWSHVIRREREEELISRGWQYAEAIRVFQNRFQRLPVRLDELIKTEPRSIRKLWKDPMTDDGKWVLIPPGQTGRVLTPQPGSDGRGDQNQDQGGEGPGEPSEEVPGDNGIGEKKGTVQVGPFIGVHSRSSKESILVFNGHNRYDEWQFTFDMLSKGGVRTGHVGGEPAVGLQLSTRWLGRPLPAFVQQLQGIPQDGQMPTGDTPGRGPKGGTRGGKPIPR
jgi:type II secretory pathway pseudopilin PulG